jgi:hypothetical protein
MLVGDLRRYGLPAPDHRVLESHPIMNTQILHFLAHGDIRAKPDIARLDGRRVHFADGSVEEVDLIVWATGYRASIPFLARALPHRDGTGPDLFATFIPPGVPDLFVVGHFETDGGAYPLVSKQAALIALVARAHTRSPDDARAWVNRLTGGRRPNLTGGVRYVSSPRHANYAQFETYSKYLGGLLARARKEL